MKKAKNAVNDGYKEKNSLDRSNKNFLPSNQLGFTLIELMVSSGIGILVSLGIASVFIFTIQQFTLIIEKNAAEESHLWSTYYTRLYLGQAVEVTATNATPAAGQLKIDFNLRANNPGNGTIRPFALFQRENGVNNNSELEATGIFLKNFNTAVLADEYENSQAVIFDLGCNNAGASGTCVLNPTRNDLYFDRLSRFEIQTNAAGCLQIETEPPVSGCQLPGSAAFNGARLKTVTLVIGTRYFNGMNRNNWFYDRGFTWRSRAPAGSVANGSNDSSYKDIESTLKVTLRNNVLSSTPLTGGTTGRQERAHGGIYYFMPRLPRPTF